MGACARSGDGAAVAVAVALVIAVAAGLRLGSAAWAVLRLEAGDCGDAVAALVRFEHRGRSRAYLEIVDRDGSRMYQGVFFHRRLLALGGPVQVAGSSGRRRAYRGAGGVIACPAGRARHEPPSGRAFDVPPYSAAALAERARSVSSVRRRIVVDAPSGTAGAAPALLYALSVGGGAATVIGAIAVGVTWGYWYAALLGTDPG